MQMGKLCQVNAIVNESMLASTNGGGDVRVLGTPAMIALMEQAAVQCMDGLVGEGETTVGTQMDVIHIAAVPTGGQITATAEVIQQSGRKVMFKVFCEDRNGLIGKGTHMRIVVNRDQFQQNAQKKLVRA